MKNYKQRKGITLIELIITLGLIGVITVLVFSFFFSNKKTLNMVEIKSDLQYESKVIMDKFAFYAMEAVNGQVTEENGNKVISFDIFDSVAGNVKKDEVKFTFKDDNVALSESSDTSDIELCKTEGIKVSADITVTDKQGIKIKLNLQKKDINYSVEDSFIFRNSHIQGT